MKVLLVTVRSDPGGGPEHVFRLAQGLLEQQVSVCIASPADPPYRSRYVELAGASSCFVLPHRKFSFRSLLRLVQFVKRQHVECVHSHGRGAGIYSRLLSFLTGIPCVHTFHGIHLQSMSPLKAFVNRMLEKGLSWKTERCLSVSEGEAAEALRFTVCSSEKLQIIPNGVCLPAEPCRSSCAVEYDIVHVTRFDPVKNSGQLVDVAKELRRLCPDRNIRIAVLGDGDGGEVVRQLADREGFADVFHFLGAVDDIRPYLRSARCMVSTSVREGLPLAVLEAMSEMRPVVATDVVGNRDAVVHEQTGYLYPLERPAEAARRIADILGDDSLADELGVSGYRRVQETFSLNAMCKSVAEVYFAIRKGNS